MFTKPSSSMKQSFSRSSKQIKSSSSCKVQDAGISKRRAEPRSRRPTTSSSAITAESSTTAATASSGISPIVTLVVGQEQRIFAAHEDVLTRSPYFTDFLKFNYSGPDANKRITLPDESPEIFSSILEYLYKGDYFPRLVHNKRRNSWEMESANDARGSKNESTVYHHSAEGPLLKDTVIYCAADKYGLEELKRIALRKQGLQSGIQCSTILSSARYAYAHTPDTDSKLRAHYLALIIRSRSTFKRSGTMQLEMYNGGSQMFFDLFVALCNHVDDAHAQFSPRSNRFH